MTNFAFSSLAENKSTLKAIGQRMQKVLKTHKSAFGLINEGDKEGAKTALTKDKYKYHPDLLTRSRSYRVNVDKLQRCKLLTSLIGCKIFQPRKNFNHDFFLFSRNPKHGKGFFSMAQFLIGGRGTPVPIDRMLSV